MYDMYHTLRIKQLSQEEAKPAVLNMWTVEMDEMGRELKRMPTKCWVLNGRMAYQRGVYMDSARPM
jgi:hypothetical protein